MKIKVAALSIFLLGMTFLFNGCITPYEPITTFEEVHQQQEKKIEQHVQHSLRQSLDSAGIYESLAFGELYVYKPQIFYTLDSLYSIKDSLIRTNQQREIITSNLELYIEENQIVARQQMEEIRYEKEHIYCVRGDQYHTIRSEIFYLDHMDSVFSVYRKFNFSIPRSNYNQYKNYLFEMHFTTPRELYISTSERDFIRLFKIKEMELYGTDEHEPFLRHTLQLMKLGSTINTIDYVALTKSIASALITQKSSETEIKEIGALIAIENPAKQVIGYEITVTWKDSKSAQGTINSILEFDPYLRLVNLTETTNL